MRARRNFARKPVEGRLVELALGIGLFRLDSERKRSRTTSAMATMSPELILASYSCARRDHMVRLIRARPLSVQRPLDHRRLGSLRMPTERLPLGTRSVIFSLTKLMTNNSSHAPATSCSSMDTI